MHRKKLNDAYAACLAIATSHYENFPVASVFIPKRFRHPIAAIYAFSRSADDIADEGSADPAERIASLNEYDLFLDTIGQNDVQNDGLFLAVSDTITSYELPVLEFKKLLNAFRSDVTKKRYQNRTELLNYCNNSANPIGRLMLALFKKATKKNIIYSDKLCSALQLINFLQDIRQDYEEMGRIYIPLDELKKFDLTEIELFEEQKNSQLQSMFQSQLSFAFNLLKEGAPLCWEIKGRFGIELRLILFGAFRIVQHLQNQQGSIFQRPRLNFSDKIWMVWHALFSNSKIIRYYSAG